MNVIWIVADTFRRDHIGGLRQYDHSDSLSRCVGSRGLDAGCGAAARDVFSYWEKGYDIYGVDAIEENIEEARTRHPEIAQRVSVADLRQTLG